MFGVLNKIFNHVSDDFCFYIRRSNGLNRLAFVSFSSLVLLLAVLLNPPMPEFERANALTGVAVAADTSISITSTDASASIDLTNKISSAGSFTASADEESINFSLNTNNYTGYTLSIVANDDEGSLTTSDNSGSLASVSSITATSDFSNNRDHNGKWGLRPSKYMTDEGNIITNNSEDPVYLPSPTTTPTVLDKTTAANESNMSNDYAIALGARVDWSVQPGAYSRTFSLVALANPAPYSIVYDKNTNDSVANLPVAQTSDSMTETNISLSNSIPTREHYSFLGWCSVATTNSNGVDSCSGTIYNPNGDGTNLTYGIDQTTTNNTRLYAMWKLNAFTCNKRYRLENANGSWGAYQIETPETVIYGGTCSYSKQINNYKSQNGANNSAVSTSVSNISADVTLSLDLYRNLYTITFLGGEITTGYEGTVQTLNQSSRVPAVQKLVSLNTNTNYTLSFDYVGTQSSNTFDVDLFPDELPQILPTATTTWQHEDWTFSSTSTNMSNAYLRFFDDIKDATYYGGVTIQNIALSQPNVQSRRWGSTLGTLPSPTKSGYVLVDWNTAPGGNGTSISSSTTVSGDAVYYGQWISGVSFQNATSAQCGQTMYDSRGDTNYRRIAYTTASINGVCWMTRNLDLPSGTTLTPEDSNVTSNYTLHSTGLIYDIAITTGNTTCAESSPCYSYYTLYAATATTNRDIDSGNAASDICPKGWRLPTSSEYTALINVYATGAALTAAPWKGVYAGVNLPVNGRLFRDVGVSASYWSSTANGTRNGYHMYFNSSSAKLSNSGDSIAASVRCVAKT